VVKDKNDDLLADPNGIGQGVRDSNIHVYNRETECLKFII
jgi:hypothetical protein